MPRSGRPLRTTAPILSPLYVLGDEFGAGEVGSGLSTAGVAAVAEGAMLLKEGLAGEGDEGFVVLRIQSGRQSQRKHSGRDLQTGHGLCRYDWTLRIRLPRWAARSSGVART